MRKPAIGGAEVPTDTHTTLAMLDRDPASVYRRLRNEMPVARIAAIGRIVLTKAEDIYRAKTDTEHFGSYDTTSAMHRAFGGHTLMRKDGCEHLRERRAMEAAFAPGHLQQNWQQKFEDLVEGLVGRLEGKDQANLLPDFAAPLSAGYLKLVLGLDNASEDQLFRWASALVEGAMNAGEDPGIFEKSDRANAEMDACFDQMIAHHRKHPGRSVLSSMANEADPIALSQIRTNMKICIGGAVIESRDAVLSTIYGLLSRPDQKRYCLENAAWGLACEEGLRWVAPIQASPRIVKKPVVIRGVLIPEGETIMAIQASANHDEDIWNAPDLFDVTRARKAHQTFGDGPHRCLGGGIYRLLASEVVLPKLFARFPDMTLKKDATVEFRGFAFRGPTSMHVALKQTRARV